jgi:hypothetical protein
VNDRRVSLQTKHCTLINFNSKKNPFGIAPCSREDFSAPFYVRKSISAGPFRFNFSKGGVGVSVEASGLGQGLGAIISMRRWGALLPRSLGNAGRRSASPLQPPRAQQRDVAMIDVDSGDAIFVA